MRKLYLLLAVWFFVEGLTVWFFGLESKLSLALLVILGVLALGNQLRVMMAETEDQEGMPLE